MCCMVLCQSSGQSWTRCYRTPPYTTVVRAVDFMEHLLPSIRRKRRRETQCIPRYDLYIQFSGKDKYTNLCTKSLHRGMRSLTNPSPAEFEIPIFQESSCPMVTLTAFLTNQFTKEFGKKEYILPSHPMLSVPLSASPFLPTSFAQPSTEI